MSRPVCQRTGKRRLQRRNPTNQSEWNADHCDSRYEGPERPSVLTLEFLAVNQMRSDCTIRVGTGVEGTRKRRMGQEREKEEEEVRRK